VENTAQSMADDSMAIRSKRPSLYRRLAGNRYLVHNIIVLIATVATGAINYLLNPVLIYLLGLAQYSKFISLIGLLTVVLTPTQVIGVIIAKYASSLGAAGRYDQLNDLFRRLTVILLPVGIVCAIIFAAFSGQIAAFLHLQSTQQVLIISIALVLAFIGPVSGGAVQGLERFSWYSINSLATPVLRLVLIIVLVDLGFGINGALIGLVLAAALTYFLSLVPLRDLLRGSRAPSGSLRPLVSYSVTAIIALASTTLLMNADTILAGHFLTAQKAGLYDGLAVIGRTVLFVSASVAAVMFPRVAALHERGERTIRVVLQALLGVFVLSLSVEAVFLVAPRVVIRILSHNPALETVADQLVWYGLAMLLLAMAQALINYFLSIGSRLFVIAVGACCALQAVLIVVRHASVAQFVQDVVIANGLLFAILFVLLFVSAQGVNTRPLSGFRRSAA